VLRQTQVLKDQLALSEAQRVNTSSQLTTTQQLLEQHKLEAKEHEQQVSGSPTNQSIIRFPR
jgi:hypothetical protein